MSEIKSKLNPTAKEFIPQSKQILPIVKNKKIYLNNIYSISKHSSKKYNKIIYIFGEKHRENTICETYYMDKPITRLSVEIPKNLTSYYDRYYKNISDVLVKLIKKLDIDHYLLEIEWNKLVSNLWIDEEGKWPNNNQKAVDDFLLTINIIRKELSLQFPILLQPSDVINVDKFIQDVIDIEEKVY